MTSDRKPNRNGAGVVGFLLVLFALGCASASEITEVPSNALVVDVRTSGEYEVWHYPEAINIPVQELEKRLIELPEKNKYIIVYCRSGNRSTTAKRILISNGFKNVKNGGGLNDMKKLLP